MNKRAARTISSSDPGRTMILPSKPTTRLRFTRIENDRFGASRSAPVTSLSRSGPGPILILRLRGRVIIVEEASIDWIHAAGNYVKLHAGQDRHRVRGTLKDLEGVLPRQFIRSHRCTIINVAAVHEFVHTPFGDLIAVLRSGDRLTVGRTYRRRVEAAFSVRL